MELTALDLLDRLKRPRILVLGDIILDRYVWGDVERVSPEAPVLVLRVDSREDRLGGAGNVAQVLASLEADVTLAGLTGNDPAADTVAQLIARTSVATSILLRDASRPTTIKDRFMGRAENRYPHQVLRVDTERAESMPSALENELLSRLLPQVSTFACILVADYGKGTCTERILSEIISAAKSREVPVLVDPARTCSYSRYQDATLITPNRAEAQIATGIRIARPEDAYAAGLAICRQHHIDTAMITLDRDGIAVASERDGSTLVPTVARDVCDITGAGDVVLAVAGLACASGLSWPDAARLANIAAGLKLEKWGTAAVTRSEIRSRILSSASYKVAELPEVQSRIANARGQGKRIVFTNGCFDLLHVGHIRYLRDAASLGDVLVVGINSDASVQRLKGDGRPVIRARDRAELLAALPFVDHVLIFEEDTPCVTLRNLRPDVLVKGGNYAESDVVGHEIVTAYGGQVRVASLTHGISTSKIINAISTHSSANGRQTPP